MSEARKADAPRTPEESEPRHDNLTDSDQAKETLDERAMNAADEAGSAFLGHDKVTGQEKERE